MRSGIEEHYEIITFEPTGDFTTEPGGKTFNIVLEILAV
jgi:hypothetical protein